MCCGHLFSAMYSPQRSGLQTIQNYEIPKVCGSHRLYDAFDNFCDILRRPNAQLTELRNMPDEIN